MPEPLIVSIPHALGKDEAMRRIKSGISSVMSGVPLIKVEDETWVGDQMSFNVRALGQVASGTLDVSEDNVRLALTLPLLLRKFAARVLGAMAQGTGRLLEKRK